MHLEEAPLQSSAHKRKHEWQSSVYSSSMIFGFGEIVSKPIWKGMLKSTSQVSHRMGWKLFRKSENYNPTWFCWTSAFPGWGYRNCPPSPGTPSRLQDYLSHRSREP